MKISQNKLNVKLYESTDLVKPIMKVLWPFEHQIEKRKINVSILFKTTIPFAVKSDWTLYELIIFNMVQNAVKYNHTDGEIAILIGCHLLPESSRSLEKTHVLETEIIDTGIGIS